MARLLENGKEGKIGAIIIDCTDFDIKEEHIASKLFQVHFYEKIHKLLEKDSGFS